MYIKRETLLKPSFIAAENGSFFQALFFWRDNPQHSSKPRHHRLETKVYDSKERLSFIAELLQQLTLLCWDKATSRRVWSWLRTNSLSPVLPLVWFVVSQGLTEGQSPRNSSLCPKELWKAVQGSLPQPQPQRNRLCTHRLTQAELPKQLPILLALLAPRIHFFSSTL